MVADVQDVSNLWVFIVLMMSILHGLMMKSIYQNAMTVTLTVGHMNIANMIKKIDYFFSNFRVILFYIFLLLELADLIQNCQFN